MNSFNHKLEKILNASSIDNFLSILVSGLLILGSGIVIVGYYSFLLHAFFQGIQEGNTRFIWPLLIIGIYLSFISVLIVSCHDEFIKSNPNKNEKTIYYTFAVVFVCSAITPIFLCLLYASGWLLHYTYINDVPLWLSLFNIGLSIVIFAANIGSAISIIRNLIQKFLP